MKRNSTGIKFILVILCCVLLFGYYCGFHLVTINKNEKVVDKNFMNLLTMRYINVENMVREIILPPSCGHFPARENLNISDKYWQVTKTTNGTFYLFNAYYDDREAVNGSLVRILGLINRIRPTVKTYCQMWFFGMLDPIPVEVHDYRVLWPDYWGENINGAPPYLISCRNPLERQGLIPTHVSLVEGECDKANNVFAVVNNRPEGGKKKLFLVALRGLNFDDDISMLMIEWAELLKILDVDKVEVYVENVHANVIKVLEHYRRSGFFIVKFIKFPHEFPHTRSESWHQWLQNDLIPYHDAFYENCYKYEFMVPMDVDEFVMPLHEEDRTWNDLISRTKARSAGDSRIHDTYLAKCMYFVLKSSHENETIAGVPKNLRFLSNIYRSTTFTADNGGCKSFMRMDRVLIIHNHAPLGCIDPTDCNIFEINGSDGHLSHYRTDCDTPECVASKPNPVKDTRLWKYKDELLRNVNATVNIMREEL